MAGSFIENLKRKARRIKADTYALYLAIRDPRTPWYARVLAVIVVGYALTPIDIIPDFVPLLGFLDDLILLPLGIWLVVKLVPSEVMAECRERGAKMAVTGGTEARLATIIIIIVWVLIAVIVIVMIYKSLSSYIRIKP